MLLTAAVVLCGALWVCLLSRGRTAALFFPLPYGVPGEIIVIDSATSGPIPDAVVRAEWWCHDNPLPDGPGSFTVMSEATTDAEGRAGLTVPKRRGGWFGCSLAVTISKPGYIPAGILVDPVNIPLPESVATWPFRTTVSIAEFPETLTVYLESALPVYLSALVDDDAFIRAVAAEELGALEPVLVTERDEVVLALTNALDDSDAQVRRNAAQALGVFADDACGSMPVLVELVFDEDEWVRLEACTTLGLLMQAGCLPTNGTIDALIRALSDEFAWVRRAAAEGLRYAGPDGTGALDALTRALEDDDAQVREYAAWAIEEIRRAK
ncbi:MAG: HEAT repeat domain-containing protein [Deltaproteobacteria bacterium]|nr:HEAT repeat domain-containing protein [Candidatus Zymogenaceae bacterium]